MPLGSDAVVTVSCGGAMTMLSAIVAFALELSITWTVKFDVPATDGVPLMLPPALRTRPVGSEPALKVQPYPPVPPLAAKVC